MVVVGVLTAAYLGNHWRLERVEAERGRLEAESARAAVRDAREFTQVGGALAPSGQWQAMRAASVAALEPYGCRVR